MNTNAKQNFKKIKKLFLLTATLAITVLGVNAQTKKDGTPDMRYKANKEMYGNSFSTPSYSTPSYSTPSYSTPSYSTPSYSTPFYSKPKQKRNYDNGGQLKMQNGYMKRNGTYVEPHLKTTPDNNKLNNKSYWDYK